MLAIGEHLSPSQYLHFTGRHSDINLVELGNGVKEDDSAVLLEGGGLQSAPPRVRSSSVTSQIVRFVKIVGDF